jgi:hypothetical protein
MSLSNLKDFLAIVAPIMVAIEAIIALLQLRNQNLLRQIDIVLRLYSKFGDEAFARHFIRFTNLNLATYEDYLKNSSPDNYLSLAITTGFFE